MRSREKVAIDKLVNLAAVVLVVGVVSFVASVVGLMTGENVSSKYEFDIANPGESYREGVLFICDGTGDRMVTTREFWQRYKKLAQARRPVPVYPPGSGVEREETGGVIGNFTEEEARRVFALARSLIAGKSGYDRNDEKAIQRLVDEIRRAHGEDTTPAPPWPIWVKAVWITFGTCFVLFWIFAYVVAGLEARLKRRALAD